MSNQVQSAQPKKKNNLFGFPYSCSPKSPSVVYTSSGKSVLPRNRYFIKGGKQVSEPDKPVNLREYLKINQASCDLGNIVARLSSGDESVINVKTGGITGDFSSYPNSVNAVSEIHKNMLRTFNSLSPEVKALFKNEEEFYSSCLDGSLSSKLASIKQSVPVDLPEPAKEVIKEEQTQVTKLVEKTEEVK